MYFIRDQATSDQPLKWLGIVEEFTRECLALEVHRGITSERVIDVLVKLFLTHGLPVHLRCENGPKFIANTLCEHLAHAQVQTLNIEPGSPWEIGYAEPFFSRLPDELLNRHFSRAKQRLAGSRIGGRRTRTRTSNDHTARWVTRPRRNSPRSGLFPLRLRIRSNAHCEANAFTRYLNPTPVTLDQLCGALQMFNCK